MSRSDDAAGLAELADSGYRPAGEPVGLVEPMRTEDAHQRRGIASHLLAAGLERLTAGGCERLKVSNDISLYLRAGFEPLRTATLVTYARPAASEGDS